METKPKTQGKPLRVELEPKVRGRYSPTVEAFADPDGLAIRVDFDKKSDVWTEISLPWDKLVPAVLQQSKWTNRLQWQPVPEHKGALEAILGVPEDGVRFTLTTHPTCYRRGPYRLLVEVLPGDHHHNWGCFDDADQPMRHYHAVSTLLTESEAIAAVLLRDRFQRGNCPWHNNPETEPAPAAPS